MILVTVSLVCTQETSEMDQTENTEENYIEAQETETINYESLIAILQQAYKNSTTTTTTTRLTVIKTTTQTTPTSLTTSTTSTTTKTTKTSTTTTTTEKVEISIDLSTDFIDESSSEITDKPTNPINEAKKLSWKGVDITELIFLLVCLLIIIIILIFIINLIFFISKHCDCSKNDSICLFMNRKLLLSKDNGNNNDNEDKINKLNSTNNQKEITVPRHIDHGFTNLASPNDSQIYIEIINNETSIPHIDDDENDDTSETINETTLLQQKKIEPIYSRVEKQSDSNLKSFRNTPIPLIEIEPIDKFKIDNNKLNCYFDMYNDFNEISHVDQFDIIEQTLSKSLKELDKIQKEMFQDQHVYNNGSTTDQLK
jgi:hypothetical protein